MAFDDVIDPAAVRAYVTEAVERYGDYKGRTSEVLAASRAAARVGRGKSKPGAPRRRILITR